MKINNTFSHKSILAELSIFFLTFLLIMMPVVYGNEFPIQIVNSPEFKRIGDDYQKAQFLVKLSKFSKPKEKLLIRNLLWRYLNKHLHDKSKNLNTEIKKVIAFSAKYKISTPADWVKLIREVNKRKQLLQEIDQGKLIPDLKTAIEIMPCYYHFLNELKKRGFEFWSFRKYWQADKTKLPKKLLVIRHDVHTQDLPSGYASYVIEKGLLHSDDVATYYVMWGFPKETKMKNIQDKYLKFIKFLNKNQVDVQPHISPIDLYLTAFPDHQKPGSINEWKKMFAENYRIKKYHDGIEYEITGEDVLGLNHINAKLPELLKAFNSEWQKATGLKVSSYAGHGTETEFADIFDNFKLLNQRVLLKLNIYPFDTYNTVIHNKLTYISDNLRPLWIEFPELVKDGQHQFLMHPDVWWDKMR